MSMMKKKLPLIILVIATIAGSSNIETWKKKVIMNLPGIDLFNILSKEVEQFKDCDFLLYTDTSVLNSTLIYRNKVSALIKDTVEVLYREGKNYYLIKKPLNEYSSSGLIKEGQNTPAHKKFSDQIRRFKQLKVIMILQRNGIEIMKEAVGLEVFI